MENKNVWPWLWGRAIACAMGLSAALIAAALVAAWCARLGLASVVLVGGRVVGFAPVACRDAVGMPAGALWAGALAVVAASGGRRRFLLPAADAVAIFGRKLNFAP